MLEIQTNVDDKKPKDKPKKLVKSEKRTHLYLHDQKLKAIPQFPISKHISVLYLYNNEIQIIENLNEDIYPNLKFLYLHNNKIKKMETLKFSQLKKLYIGYNHIPVIEGLECLPSLEELHVENQMLPSGVELCFDPRSCLNLSRILRTLNISNNKISSFASLYFLKELEYIDASNCGLEDLKEVCDTIKNWRFLTEAYFHKNKFCKNHRYREDIIVSCHYLETLDGKDVSDYSREFLKRMDARKMLMGKSKSVNLADIVNDLPKNYPPPIQKAASAQVLKGNKYNPLSSFDGEAESVKYVPWKGLPKRRPFVKKSPPKLAVKSDEAIIVNKC